MCVRAGSQQVVPCLEFHKAYFSSLKTTSFSEVIIAIFYKKDQLSLFHFDLEAVMIIQRVQFFLIIYFLVSSLNLLPVSMLRYKPDTRLSKLTPLPALLLEAGTPRGS